MANGLARAGTRLRSRRLRRKAAVVAGALALAMLAGFLLAWIAGAGPS